MKKWTETDLEKQLAYIKKSACQHAGEQMNIAEMYLRKHPGENAAFDSAPALLHGYMGKKLDFRFADDCRSVYMRYAGTMIRYNKLRKFQNRRIENSPQNKGQGQRHLVE